MAAIDQRSSISLENACRLVEGWKDFFFLLSSQPVKTSAYTAKGFYDWFTEPTHGFLDIGNLFLTSFSIFLSLRFLSIYLPLSSLRNGTHLIYRTMMAFEGDKASSEFLWEKAERTDEYKYIESHS